MPGYEIWDIVKVPFPYAKRPVQQRRPALVVAMPETPGAPPLLWVLMVTSAANRGLPGDVVVTDLAKAGLPAPSVVRAAKIATIKAADAERIGQLCDADVARVMAALRLNIERMLG
jgi:mRNA interferase MazF